VRHIVRSQDGVALPVASAMMLVISLLVVAFFGVALQLNDTSNEDRRTKRALAAAEAGLQMAVYQLGQLDELSTPTKEVKNASCMTNVWVTLPSSGECPGHPGDLGNGASYTYYVTPVLATGADCVLRPGEVVDPADRCITSIGTVGGVQRRLQVRATMLTGAASFKSIGLMSKSLMYAGNSSEIRSDVGVNGVAHFGNSAKTFATSVSDGAVLRPPGSSYETSGSSQVIAGGQQSVSTPFVFPPIKFEEAELAALNLQAGWLQPSDTTYSATTKQFRVTGTASLPAGTYYFCRFSMANGAKLTFSNSQATHIYVDSPSRSGSQCTGQADPAGTFWTENSNEFNKDGREELVDVFVHGTSQNGIRSWPSFCTPAGDPPTTDRCESDVLLNNSSWFEGSIYAPDTTVEINNSGNFIGAIAGDEIRFNNSIKFELTAAMKDSAPEISGGVERGSWIECEPTATVSGDPESGC
jgi:Tfp pilus assembly protein PilX